MPRSILIGCRVDGAHGPLMEHDSTQNNVETGNRQRRPRRKRQVIMGTVISHAGENWVIRWDDDAVAIAEYRPAVLRFLAEAADPPMTEPQCLQYMSQYTPAAPPPAAIPAPPLPLVPAATQAPPQEPPAPAATQAPPPPHVTQVPPPPPPPVATQAPPAPGAAPAPPHQEEAAAAAEEEDTAEEIGAPEEEEPTEEQDPDEAAEEDVPPVGNPGGAPGDAEEGLTRDPRVIESLTESTVGDQAIYQMEKSSLMGQEIVKATGHKLITWIVRSDVKKADAGEWKEHRTIGVRGFIADPSSFEREIQQIREQEAEERYLVGSPSQRTRTNVVRHEERMNERRLQAREARDRGSNTTRNHQQERFERSLHRNKNGEDGNVQQQGFGSDERVFDERANLSKLLILLWPGNWRLHLHKINQGIELQNVEIEEREAGGQYSHRTRPQKIRLVSAKEFWTYWGLFLYSAVVDAKGNLWQKAPEREGMQSPACNMTRFMAEHRFQKIRRFVPMMAAVNERKESDPWWQVSAIVEDFNKNRQSRVAAGRYKVMDESMIGFRPRTTKLGDPPLPNISHILRKPVPLGIELKNIACATTDLMLHLEIQKGKDPMRQQKYSQEHGGTCGCTLRMMESVKKCRQDDKNRDGTETPADIGLGDSWFASVNTAEQCALLLKSNFCGIVKTAHSRYPKAWLEGKMKQWPAGAHLVLEGTTSTGVRLLAIGYKYNKKKVLCFISTADGGHTEPGEPYKAKWIGENGEKFTKNVPRPDIVARYFVNSNTIDKHNHARQGILGLEEQWVTTNPFFRFITSMIGIVVTDCWKAYKYQLGAHHRHKNVSIMRFADMLVHDLLNRTPFSEVNPSFLPQIYVGERDEEGGSIQDVSPLTERTGRSAGSGGLSSEVRMELRTARDLCRDHILVKTDIREPDGLSWRKKRMHCEMCRKTSPKRKNKTSSVCRDCGIWVCGSVCLNVHIQDIIREREASIFA